MLTLLYALALSSAVGDCPLATDDLEAWSQCAFAPTETHSAPSRSLAEIRAAHDARAAGQPVLGRRINTYQDLANQRAIHAAQERDNELRLALEQQRLERHLARMRQISAEREPNPYVTTVNVRSGRVSIWRILNP